MNFNMFQWVALPIVSILFIASVTAVLRRATARRDAVLWALIWFIAGLCIARPGITAAIARALGIGRGTDLVLYCAVLVMLIGFLMVYTRLRRLNRELTLVVRHIAIQEAEAKQQAHP